MRFRLGRTRSRRRPAALQRIERIVCLADGSGITRDRVIKAVRGAQRIAGHRAGRAHPAAHVLFRLRGYAATADKSHLATIRGRAGYPGTRGVSRPTRIRDWGCGTGDAGLGIRDSGFRIRDSGLGIPDERSGMRDCGAGYGDRTRLAGLGSQSITTMLSPHRSSDRSIFFGLGTSSPDPWRSRSRGPNAPLGSCGSLALLVRVEHRTSQLRMNASTSSRFCSIISCVVASRFRRSSGSVFEARTLKCQLWNSAEMPSMA